MQSAPNTNEPVLNSFYWNLWKMGLTPLNQMLNTNFYASLRGGTYNEKVIWQYNMNDYYLENRIHELLEKASSMPGVAPHPSLQYALFYLNNQLTTRMSSYETVWHLEAGIWAPTDVCMQYEQFLSQTLQNEGVFYFMCTVLARLTLWGVFPETVQPSNPDYAAWVQWKNTQTISYGTGNQLGYYASDNPELFDIHKALSIYGDSLNHEVDMMQNAM